MRWQLEQSPPGMTIVADTGLILYAPTAAELGAVGAYRIGPGIGNDEPGGDCSNCHRGGCVPPGYPGRGLVGVDLADRRGPAGRRDDLRRTVGGHVGDNVQAMKLVHRVAARTVVDLNTDFLSAGPGFFPGPGTASRREKRTPRRGVLENSERASPAIPFGFCNVKPRGRRRVFGSGRDGRRLDRQGMVNSMAAAACGSRRAGDDCQLVELVGCLTVFVRNPDRDLVLAQGRVRPCQSSPVLGSAVIPRSKERP